MAESHSGTNNPRTTQKNIIIRFGWIKLVLVLHVQKIRLHNLRENWRKIGRVKHRKSEIKMNIQIERDVLVCVGARVWVSGCVCKKTTNKEIKRERERDRKNVRDGKSQKQKTMG